MLRWTFRKCKESFIFLCSVYLNSVKVKKSACLVVCGTSNIGKANRSANKGASNAAIRSLI